MGLFRRGKQWWIDYYFEGKRYRTPAGANKRQAQAALDRVKGRIASRDFTPPRRDHELKARIPFEKAVETYVDQRLAEGKSERSYTFLAKRKRTANGVALADWLEPFRGKRLADLTTDMVEARLNWLADKHKLAPASRNNALAQLSGLMTFAIGKGWIELHPIDRGRIPRLPTDNARTRWLRIHELEELQAAAERLGHGWMISIIRFGAMTGMRLNEICRLTRATYQVDERRQAYVVTEHRTKNGERLIWPLEGWAREHVKARVDEADFPADLLFPGPDGGNAYTSIRRHFRAVVEAAGLPWGRSRDGVTFHTLRHTMASLALNAGVPEATVQRMGNWKTRAMVERYAHLADETLRSGAANVAALFGDGHNAVTRSSKAGRPPKLTRSQG